MLFRTRGCLVAFALDAVDGVFEGAAQPDGRRASLPEGGSVPLVDWSDLTGVPPADGEGTADEVVVVSAGSGRFGLAVERCLGTRRVSLTAARPLPTRLVDERGSPACLLLRIDGRPVFLLEPRALGGAARLDGASPGHPAGEPGGNGAAVRV